MSSTSTTQNHTWLELSPSQSPVLSPGLTPNQKIDDIPTLERTKSNNSTNSFLRNFDVMRQPIPSRCPTTQPAFHNMRGESRAEAAEGLRLAAYMHN